MHAIVIASDTVNKFASHAQLTLAPLHNLNMDLTAKYCTAKYRFSFRKEQIFISQRTDFISQRTDFHFATYGFHFATYRFSFRKVRISFLGKVQIFISQSTDSISFRFVSQSTIGPDELL